MSKSDSGSTVIPVRSLMIAERATLVRKLHVAPAFLELWIVSPSVKAPQRLEMDGPVMTDFLRNKFGQSGVAQRHKATRRDAIGGMKKSMAQIKLKYVNGFRNRDRKSQRVRYYFRRRGAKAIALPGLPGSEKLWRPTMRRSPITR